MNLLPVYSTNFYEFHCDPVLLEEILTEVTDIKYINNQLNYRSAKDYFHEKLFNWLENCLVEVKDKLSVKESVELVITTSWVNKTTKLSKHHKHSHPNSFAVGILYLTTHESAYTNFYHKNDWFVGNQIVPFEGFSFYEDVSKIKPEAGKLIIFPGNTVHDTGTLKLNEPDRYTISFNTFFQGKINDNVSESLQIKTSTVRERFYNGEI